MFCGVLLVRSLVFTIVPGSTTKRSGCLEQTSSTPEMSRTHSHRVWSRSLRAGSSGAMAAGAGGLAQADVEARVAEARGERADPSLAVFRHCRGWHNFVEISGLCCPVQSRRFHVFCALARPRWWNLRDSRTLRLLRLSPDYSSGGDSSWAGH